MDAFDRHILLILQADARTTVADIAREAQLSVSACHRRLRSLEANGVIDSYQALVNPTAIGLGFQALVFATMEDGRATTLRAFEAGLQAIREIVDAQRLFGEPDYLLRIFTKDLETFQHLYDSSLTTLPGVRRFNTTIIMKDIVNARPFKIAEE